MSSFVIGSTGTLSSLQGKTKQDAKNTKTILEISSSQFAATGGRRSIISAQTIRSTENYDRLDVYVGNTSVSLGFRKSHLYFSQEV